MSAKNKARKSTGPRATSTPYSTNLVLRQRGSTQVSNNTIAQGDSSDSDVPTQRLQTRNQNSTIQSTPGPSKPFSRASTSKAVVDSDSDEQSTLRLSSGRNRNFRRVQIAESSSSDTTSDSDEAPAQEKSRNGKEPTKKRKVIQRRNSSVASDEDFQPSPSTSQASSTPRRVSNVHNKSISSPNKSLQSRSISSLVNKCVYYLLIADQKKCPIKKIDILKHVFSAPERKYYAEVVKEAGSILKKTYGMEIIVSEKRKVEYMLINILNHDLGIQEFIDYSALELQKRGLILYLLTVIFMNEQSITEDALTIALKPLGIDLKARLPHPDFGDVRGYLTKELVKQNYLEYKCISKEPPQYEFSWGERAYQEVDKKDLLEFACQIMGDTRPEEWILQYNDAMSRRQESA